LEILESVECMEIMKFRCRMKNKKPIFVLRFKI
jgi:hypothetical protein